MKNRNLILNSVLGLTLSSLLALAPNSALAISGGETGGGGDAVVQEFITVARQLVLDLRLSKENAFPEVAADDLENTINKSEVKSVTDVKLGKPELGEFELDAANFPDLNLIIVNRSRWGQLKEDYNRKRALVFHEYLGLMKFDDSKYTISGRMIQEKIRRGFVTQNAALQRCSSDAASITLMKVEPCIKKASRIQNLDTSAFAGLSFARAESYFACAVKSYDARKRFPVRSLQVIEAFEKDFRTQFEEKDYCDLAATTDHYMILNDRK